MTDRLELNWNLDGTVSEQRFYCSETPINTNAPPTPVAILSSSDRTHIEYGLTLGKYYYTRISAYKNGVEKFSDEEKVLFGEAWTPQNLSNAPKLRTDGDNVLTSSTQVTQLTDLSGNNYHFTQSTASYRPTLQFDSEINHNVIIFNGTSSRLINLSAQNIAKGISKFWSLAVYKKNSTDIAGAFRNIFQFCRGDSSGATARLGIYAGFSTDPNKGAIYVRPTDSVSAAAGKFGESKSQIWTIMFSQWDGNVSELKLAQDGVVSTSLTTGIASQTSNTVPSGTPATIGCGASGTITAYDGFADISLACLIVGSGTLPSESERQKLEGWAAHKYGLTGNLPAGHPYKILAPVI